MAERAGIAHIEILVRNTYKSNACTRYLTINTSSRARIAGALYGCRVLKGGDVASADPGDDGPIAGQIDHGCRRQAAISAIEDQVHTVLEALVDFPSVGAWQILPGQQQGGAHDRFTQFGQK